MAAFGANQDLYLVFCVIFVLLIFLVPLPPLLLDILLTINISVSVVVLLSTVYIQRPTEFSVFPALLLMLTLFRLVLNIASTRMILAEGHGGNVIGAFGNFVTSGNIFVGIVMFSILVIVQFVVITKGATRISEVAARFTLDAMPGKQMGVDSDLNAGLLTEQEARKRRRDIEREADFYGAMDGATKFVRGDAVAGLIITIINIVAGFGVGMYMMDMTAGESFYYFTTLTIGDGLVSQIPSLVISIAAGLVVTRTVSDENLGSDLASQLTQQPRALGSTAALLMLAGLVPALPQVPFFGVGIFLAILAYFSGQMIIQRKEDVEAEEAKMSTATDERPPARTEDLLTVDSLKIELGYGLITMADPGQGGDLLTRIQVIRQQIATKMGFIVPVIRIVDNMRLRPNEYQVKLRESVIASYELMPDHFLAMNPGLVEEEIEGYPTQEPAFGLQAVWVPARDRDKAERLGYTIVEPSAVVATHLTELIMGHADELVTREDAQVLVNHLKESAPTVVEELMPKLLSMGELQKVLHNLLRERVSIRNLEMVLEVLCDYSPRTKDTEVLTEYVRHALAREICGAYSDEENVLRVVTLSPELEQEILNAVNNAQTGDYIPVAPERSDAISTRCAAALQPLVVSGQDPVVLTSAPVRRYFKRIVERHIPKVVVLSYNEIDPAVGLESVGQVSA
jgi:flagellar biosynthesis protein FlhA